MDHSFQSARDMAQVGYRWDVLSRTLPCRGRFDLPLSPHRHLKCFEPAILLVMTNDLKKKSMYFVLSNCGSSIGFQFKFCFLEYLSVGFFS